MNVFNRDKLIDQIKNKVLIGVTRPDFRIDPSDWPLLNFVVTPSQLPPKEADLQDSDPPHLVRKEVNANTVPGDLLQPARHRDRDPERR